MKTFEIRLNCDTSKALEVLMNKTDSPSGIRLFKMSRDPSFWGKFKGNHFRIWPKSGFKDISSSIIKGEINQIQEGTSIKVKIVNAPVIPIPNWLVIIAVFLGFPSFGFLMYSFVSGGKWIAETFILFLFSIFTFLVFILQKSSKVQEEELDRFIKSVFGNYTEF